MRIVRRAAALLAAALALLPVGTSPAAQPPPDGRIYHYVRTNLDGSLPEHVHVFRRSATRVEVYKSVTRCTSAALVTAEIDPVRGQARRITGGRLRPDGTQQAVAFLTYEPSARRLDVRVDVDGRRMQDTLVVDAEPWHVYDFDLASLTMTLPHRAEPRAPIRFALPVFWPRDDGAGMALRNLGIVEARFVRAERRDGRDALRFDARGSALGSRGGPLWIDAREGHVLDVEWGVPNHAEYGSFRLRLVDVDDGGPAAWERLLRSHHADCEGAEAHA